jgi:hypothetical protein
LRSNSFVSGFRSVVRRELEEDGSAAAALPPAVDRSAPFAAARAERKGRGGAGRRAGGRRLVLLDAKSMA